MIGNHNIIFINHTKGVKIMNKIFNTEIVENYVLQNNMTYKDFAKKCGIKKLELNKYIKMGM